MFGALYGDVIGSIYENACTKSYDFPLLRESHFTDDSVMTAAVCRAILNNGDNIGRFDIRKRGFEYAAQYKQYFARYPRAYVYTLGKGKSVQKAVQLWKWRCYASSSHWLCL